MRHEVVQAVVCYGYIFDRTQIVNYVQWKNREALAAARENPKIVALMSETAKIAASSKPVPYELRETVAAQ